MRWAVSTVLTLSLGAVAALAVGCFSADAGELVHPWAPCGADASNGYVVSAPDAQCDAAAASTY
jgi:hypothetical protein